jgi:hypothetical protein
VRAVRTASHKYAVYVDPNGEQPTEHEMYDLGRDPDEVANLVGLRDGAARVQGDIAALAELKERLEVELDRCGTRVRAG